MGLFRKSSPRHESGDPREDDAEISETTTPSGIARVAKVFSSGPTASPDESIRRVRADADPEDYEAESELLDEERHHEEGY
jgi:hypothetical protein